MDSITPRYIWIGNVSSNRNCRAVRIEYFSESNDKQETPAHYHYGLDTSMRWRYVETANVVMWYDDPTSLQRHAVQDYLQQRNIHVNRHMVYGRGYGDMQEEDYDCDVGHGHLKVPNHFKKIKGKPRSWKLNHSLS